MYFYIPTGQNTKLKEGDWRSGSNSGLGSLKAWSGILALSHPGRLSSVKSQALSASVLSLYNNRHTLEALKGLLHV